MFGMDDHVLSRRRVLTLAAAATLSAELVPGAFRLLGAAAALPPATVAPAGFRFLDSIEFGLRVAIPDDLVPIRPWEVLLEEGGKDVLMELTERSPGALDGFLENTDVMAGSDDGASVNVMRIHFHRVPTPADLAAETEDLQLTDVEWGQVSTVFGRATTMRSKTVLFDGAVVVPGYVLWAQNARGVFSLQVTGPSDEVTDALYAIVLRTLQPLSPGVRTG